jgi:hypothetical protein
MRTATVLVVKAADSVGAELIEKMKKNNRRRALDSISDGCEDEKTT